MDIDWKDEGMDCQRGEGNGGGNGDDNMSFQTIVFALVCSAVGLESVSLTAERIIEQRNVKRWG